MEDTTEEKKALGMRRCKSAMLAREIPPTVNVDLSAESGPDSESRRELVSNVIYIT